MTIRAQTPWFWDTPEGGGWVRYLTDGRCVDRHALARIIEAETDPDQRAEFERILADCPRLLPTAAERRAWRKIDPPAEGQTDQGEGDEGGRE